MTTAPAVPACSEVMPLTAGWEFAITPAQSATDPAALDTLTLDWLPATVPGTAAADLFALGRADFATVPVLDDHDVWYRCRFAVPVDEGLRHALDFEGLATLAQVWLDGDEVLVSSNMFLAHRVTLGAPSREGHTLHLRFAALTPALKTIRGRPRWRTRLVAQQQLRGIRTSLLGRIPGWTPPTPPVGPWRPISLSSTRVFDCETVDIHVALEGTTGVVTVDARLRGFDPGARPGTATLHVGGHAVELPVERQGDRLILRGTLRIADVALWWPHTHGAPVLHDVELRLDVDGRTQVLKHGRTGFRQLALDTADDGFALQVNGTAVFCRGACWTTTDVLRLIGDADACRDTLLMARDAGMNLLRLVGTMFYEADHFYALCDELGILVWQDWMFANMDYPGEDAAFLASVEAEARQFLSRTRISPCLAVLCGNSEVEQQAAMVGVDPAIWRSPLFAGHLPAIGAELRPDVPYWPSSPAGGALPFQVDAGVAHYFGVGAYLQPLTDARRCGVRFTSECLAFANVPDRDGVERIVGEGQSPFHHPAWKAGVPRDSGSGWDFEDVRDHYLAELFAVEPMRLRYADVDRYLDLSRVVTGEVMLAAFREWRRSGSSCHGAVVWFLRDLRPGAGWGVIDAFGEPKAAWHYLKRAAAPVALFLIDEGVNGLSLHAINDGPDARDVRIDLQLYRDGQTAVADGHRALRLPPRSVTALRGDALLGRFADTTYVYRFGPPGHDVVCATLSDADGTLLGRDFFFPLGHGFVRQPLLGLSATLAVVSDSVCELHVDSPRFAQAVCIDAPGFRADANHFHLPPAGRMVVRLTRSPGRRQALRATVTALNGHDCVRLAAPAPPR